MTDKRELKMLFKKSQRHDRDRPLFLETLGMGQMISNSGSDLVLRLESHPCVSWGQVACGEQELDALGSDRARGGFIINSRSLRGNRQ